VRSDNRLKIEIMAIAGYVDENTKNWISTTSIKITDITP